MARQASTLLQLILTVGDVAAFVPVSLQSFSGVQSSESQGEGRLEKRAVGQLSPPSTQIENRNRAEWGSPHVGPTSTCGAVM